MYMYISIHLLFSILTVPRIRITDYSLLAIFFLESTNFHSFIFLILKLHAKFASYKGITVASYPGFACSTSKSGQVTNS